YKMTLNSIDGKKVSMEKYKGRVLVVVNTASQCGFTPQMKGLEDIYQTYKTKGLDVLAFPSNDFKQDPDSNSQILSFAQDKYKISFPFFEKNSVTGEKKQPLYQYLTQNQKPTLFKDVKWNFEKFIVGRNGEVLERFSSSTKPDSEEFKKVIEKALASP
ncbi:MAG: glutathione peroxidase, partial [Bdellovibrionales bacterium]